MASSIFKTISAAAAVFFALSAYAQSNAVRSPGEGIPERITRAEAIKKAGEGFDRVDVNKDGVVTREEIIAYQQLLQKAMSQAPSSVPAPKK